MCVCMCLYVSVCVLVCFGVDVFLCACLFVCLSVCLFLYVCMRLCVCVGGDIYVYKYIPISLPECIYYMCIALYVVLGQNP